MNLFASFIAGGIACLAIDLLLHPLDTLKTRAQSEQGFFKAGGFSGVYKGIRFVLAGSIPGACVFFVVYEAFKAHFAYFPAGSTAEAGIQAIASALGAMVACIVRVPVEVVKQRAQVNLEEKKSSFDVYYETIAKEGYRGLFRGFQITVIRDSSFSLLQFPIWEQLKTSYAIYTGIAKADPLTGACLGAVAGAIAGFLTTPIDVAKTQMMLAESESIATKLGFFQSLARVASQGGIRGLFKGSIPRMSWISFGGFVFLGVYDASLAYMSPLMN